MIQRIGSGNWLFRTLPKIVSACDVPTTFSKPAALAIVNHSVPDARSVRWSRQVQFDVSATKTRQVERVDTRVVSGTLGSVSVRCPSISPIKSSRVVPQSTVKFRTGGGQCRIGRRYRETGIGKCIEEE